MDVRQAKAFLAVAEELHFGRAAARLHMAQPPLSRLIRTIEHELGAALFERSQRRVALTAVGEALLEPARELVMQSERITALVRRVRNGEVGTMRLGFAGSSTAALVSALAGEVRRELPDISLELHGAELSHSGLEKLRAGALDAVVGRWDELPPLKVRVEGRVSPLPVVEYGRVIGAAHEPLFAIEPRTSGTRVRDLAHAKDGPTYMIGLAAPGR